MIQPNRIASGLADSLLRGAKPDANPKRLIEAAFRRRVRLGVSIGAASRVARRAPFSTRRRRDMDRADRSCRSMRLKAQADRLAVDLILDCERAASRRNPRDCDPTRWGRTAWRRYLYATAHAPSIVDLQRVFGLHSLR